MNLALIFGLFALTACGPSNYHREVKDPSPRVAQTATSSTQIAVAEKDQRITLTTKDSFTPLDWIKISTDDYSFRIGPDAAEIKVQGIDSAVHSFQFLSCNILFDFGVHNSLTTDPNELIDNRPAKLTSESQTIVLNTTTYSYSTHVSFSKALPESNSLAAQAFCQNEADQTLTKIIFRSIRF